MRAIRFSFAAVLAASALVYTIRAADVQFRDDFDGALQSGWQWIDIKGDCTRSLDARPGYLRIAIIKRAARPLDGKKRLLRSQADARAGR